MDGKDPSVRGNLKHDINSAHSNKDVMEMSYKVKNPPNNKPSVQYTRMSAH